MSDESTDFDDLFDEFWLSDFSFENDLHSFGLGVDKQLIMKAEQTPNMS